MPPLGRQFRKTARRCSLALRGQTSRLENVSARSGFNRISKFITAAGSIMDSKSRPQTSYNSRPRKNLSQYAAGGIIAGRTFFLLLYLSFLFFPFFFFQFSLVFFLHSNRLIECLAIVRAAFPGVSELF